MYIPTKAVVTFVRALMSSLYVKCNGGVASSISCHITTGLVWDIPQTTALDDGRSPEIQKRLELIGNECSASAKAMII